MPRFFLHHTIADTHIPDLEGADLADLVAAEWEAVLNIRSIVGDRLLSGHPMPTGRVDIVDEDGSVLGTISHAEALTSA